MRLIVPLNTVAIINGVTLRLLKGKGEEGSEVQEVDLPLINRGNPYKKMGVVPD